MKPSVSHVWPLSLSRTPSSGRRPRIMLTCPSEALASFQVECGTQPSSALPGHHHASSFRHTPAPPEEVRNMLPNGQSPQCICAGTSTTSLCTLTGFLLRREYGSGISWKRSLSPSPCHLDTPHFRTSPLPCPEPQARQEPNPQTPG